jgi:hypothetical protein
MRTKTISRAEEAAGAFMIEFTLTSVRSGIDVADRVSAVSNDRIGDNE